MKTCAWCNKEAYRIISVGRNDYNICDQHAKKFKGLKAKHAGNPTEIFMREFYKEFAYGLRD